MPKVIGPLTQSTPPNPKLLHTFRTVRQQLTTLAPPPIVTVMRAELDTLEAKIRQVADRCHALRDDNLALRQQLLAAQQEIRHVTARLEAARSRLLSLLDKIPEDA